MRGLSYHVSKGQSDGTEAIVQPRKLVELDLPFLSRSCRACRSFCVLVVLWPFAAPLSAQDAAEMSLIVLAKGTGRALERAEVKVATDAFYTDAKGQVRITVPAGDGKILIEFHGYTKLFVDFETLRKGPEYKAYLMPGEPDDEVIVIRGNRRPEVSRKTISIEEARRIAPDGDPAKITKLMPGVQSNAFDSQVVIRGSGPQDSGYYVDQLVVPFIFHRIGDISIIPDQLISDVQFSSGGFSAQYGEATGGIIVLRTTSEVPQHAKSEFTVNLPNYSGIFTERPLDENSSVAVSARASYLQYIIPYVIPKELETTAVPYFGDAHMRYLKKVDGGHDKVLLTFSRDGLKLVSPSSEATSEDGRFRLDFLDNYVSLGVERYRSLGDGWTVRTTPQTFYSDTKVDFDANFFKISTFNFANPVEVGKRLDKDRSLYAGLDLNVYQFNIEVQAPQFIDDDPFYDSGDAPVLTLKQKGSGFSGGVWAQIDEAIGPAIVTPGFRIFHNSQISKTGYDPRLSARWEVIPELMLKAAIGQYSISPLPQEASKEFGNTKLGFEKSNHYIAGIEKKFGDRWTSELQVFHKKTYHLIFSDPVLRFNDDGTRLTDGIEVFIRRNMTERTFGWLAYTYSKSQERRNDSDGYRRSPYDQTHVLNLAGSYKLDPLWDLGLRLKYNTGTPFTPISSAVYNANLDKYQPVNDDSQIYAGRLPNYHSGDIFATRTSYYDTWKLAHRFGITLLATRPQVYAVNYNYDYSKSRQFKGIPPIPFYEVRGEF